MQRTEYLRLTSRENWFKLPAMGLTFIVVMFDIIYLAWPNACFYHYSLFSWAEFGPGAETTLIFVFLIIETINLTHLISTHLFVLYYLATYFFMMEFWTRKIW